MNIDTAKPSGIAIEPVTLMLMYGIDCEALCYDDFDDAMDALYNDARLEVGAIIHEADTKTVDLGDYVAGEIDWLLERADESIGEDCGFEDPVFDDVTPAALDELDTLLRDWTAKHITGRYWTVVGRVRERTVTIEDIAAYTEARA